MTKGELVELLLDFDDDMEIGFAFSSGDYWKTTIIRTINEVSEVEVEHSTYHEENVLVNRDNFEDSEPQDQEYDIMIALS